MPTKCNQRGQYCELMDRVLERSAAVISASGITVETVFNVRTGATRGDIVVHHCPGRGRGKNREKPFSAVLTFCPFCGEKLRPPTP